MPFPAIESLLLDLDGTLIDSRADLTDAVNAALVAVGQSPQEQSEIVPHVGNGVRRLLSDVLGPVPDEDLEKALGAFAAHYERHCLDKTKLYPHVEEGLNFLHRRFRIGVVTNKPERFARRILQELGVQPYVLSLVGGDALPDRKPHPGPLLRAVNELKSNPESALVVGDGPQDIQAGQAAGARTCVARYGFGFRSEHLELKPDYVINDFSELKEIVL
jgi:phosphoglycolate phosphatase